MDIIQIEELLILFPYSSWSSSAKEISLVLTGYSGTKIVSLFKEIIENKSLDEKLLMKLLIANKNKLPIDFYYEILSAHKKESYLSFSRYKKNINLRFSLLQQQLLRTSKDIECKSQVYHLVFNDESTKNSFLDNCDDSTFYLYFKNISKFEIDIVDAIKKYSTIFVLWDKSPDNSELNIIKKHDFWMKIVFEPFDELLGYCPLTITNSLDQKALFKNLISVMSMSGILNRYYLENDDLCFVKDLVSKRIVPEYYVSLYKNSSIAYPSEWVSLLQERRFTVEDLDKLGIFSSFISNSKLKTMLLNNDFNDLKMAFDLISSLVYSINNYGDESLSKFFKKQKIKNFENIITSLFLLQNKNNIKNCEYVTQTFLKDWKYETDSEWNWIIPISSNELFDWGYKLNNCLNTSEFHKNMILGSQYIVIAQNKINKKLFACLRIDKISGEILEVKSTSNTALDQDIVLDLNNKINYLFNKTFNVCI